MSRIFDVSQRELDENSSPKTLESWDSLNHMKLIAALEEEFGVQFKDEEALEMQSFKLVKFVLSKYLEKG